MRRIATNRNVPQRQRDDEEYELGRQERPRQEPPIVEAEVRSALEALPEHFRLPIVLSDVEGLSYKEIADVMGTPVGTVMSRLHRARKMLQLSLRDQAVALGIIEPVEEMRAAAGDTNEPVDLETYRAQKRTGKGGGR